MVGFGDPNLSCKIALNSVFLQKGIFVLLFFPLFLNLL